MEYLPDNIKRVLESLLDDLKSREAVISIGLFGSWSRGEASESSDVDLLIVDRRSLGYEYVERAEIDNIFLDLNYVPEKWVTSEFPPEIDHRLYETRILYDPDGTLRRAKETLLKMMWTSERLEIRTGNYLVEADILLSRGLSAHERLDHKSAKLNAALALEEILKIPMEVCRAEFSNSRYLRALEESMKKLNLKEIYNEYLEVSGLSKINRRRAEGIFERFQSMWGAAVKFFEANSHITEKLHEYVVNNLNFYCKQSFLRGISARTRTLLQEGLYAEATHYMQRSSVNMLENYAWLLSEIEKRQFDYTRLIEFLRDSHVSPSAVYEGALEVLMLGDVSAEDAEDSLERARSIILDIRGRRKELIAQMEAEK